jgi:hypothetical protein
MCLPVKPYKIEVEWKHAGLSCAVVLVREAAHRCGYVRVPPGHPLFGKDYNDVDVEVHGGLTFAEIEPCKEHEDGQGYWFGFDCAHAHAGDSSYDPSAETEEALAMLKIYRRFPLWPWHYWSLPEVVAETERLAQQLVEVPRGI